MEIVLLILIIPLVKLAHLNLLRIIILQVYAILKKRPNHRANKCLIPTILNTWTRLYNTLPIKLIARIVDLKVHLNITILNKIRTALRIKKFWAFQKRCKVTHHRHLWLTWKENRVTVILRKTLRPLFRTQMAPIRAICRPSPIITSHPQIKHILVPMQTLIVWWPLQEVPILNVLSKVLIH